MKKLFGQFIAVGIVALLNTQPVHAVFLSLVPSSATVTTGNMKVPSPLSFRVAVLLLFVLLLFGLPPSVTAQIKFKKVDEAANPPTDIEYHAETTYRGPPSAQGGPVNNAYLTTQVTIHNISQAAGKKLMLCLQGVSTKLSNQLTVPVRDVNVRYFETPNQFTCRISPRHPKAMPSRYGNLGCELVELDKEGSPEATKEVVFVTGSIPNQEMVPNDRRFPIQDGIP